MLFLSFLLFSSFAIHWAAALTGPMPASLSGGTAHAPAKRSECSPFKTSFTPSSVSRNGNAPFVAVSPEGSYHSSNNGLDLYLRKPQGPITTYSNHTNSVVGQGATINSTFLLQYGKVTFQMRAPLVAGVIVATIFISDGADEIDVELICGDPHHWQTNVYSPQPQDKQPLWGVFGDLESFPSGSDTITSFHNYTVDWTADRIIWSVDNHVVRTLTPSQTKINGTQHYPTQRSRLQLGIWDASTPEGTSQWAKGPIDWNKAPSTIVATIKSIEVQCH